MFVHWGLYSLLGRGEWALYLERETLAAADYERLAGRFTAEGFDADAWAATAAAAGQRYLTFTTRHHDGFSLYDTKLSAYKATNTPFGRDALAELAEACARHDVKLGCYVSVLDWHHPAYRAAHRERSGQAWADYVGFLTGQIEELCTGYGELAELWLDGDWSGSTLLDTPDARAWHTPGGPIDWSALCARVHELQPGAAVINNHHANPRAGEDVQVWEQDLPLDNPMDLRRTMPYLPLREACATVNGSWGYNAQDRAYKSTAELVGLLARAASQDANLLLNVGPDGDGVIPPAGHEPLLGVGTWLREHGHSIYGAGTGDLELPGGVVCTKAGERRFLHVVSASAPGRVGVCLPDGEMLDVRLPRAASGDEPPPPPVEI
jgi:alpha-L-fucosidase